MGLLFHNLSSNFQSVADNVYDKHFLDDPKMHQEYDDYRKHKMYEDIMHNLSFLEVSYKLDDPKLFHEYAIWLLELMIHLMPDLSKERVKEQMVKHYELLDGEFSTLLKKEDYQKVHHLLEDAITTTKAYEALNLQEENARDKYHVHRQTYLSYLLEGKSEKAIDYILELKKTQIPLEDIYVNILEKVMHQIGELWHKNEITVDQEHHNTSITQVALSQFYDTIFSTARNGQKLIACSVGSELHEMGARMVSDLFEYHGWDSTYLGAAVPEKVFLNSIKKNSPDLVVLSVTMPQHLSICYDLVVKISQLDQPPKIAVGGRAFSLTDNLWEKWPVDIYKKDAIDLLSWSKDAFNL